MSIHCQIWLMLCVIFVVALREDGMTQNGLTGSWRLRLAGSVLPSLSGDPDGRVPVGMTATNRHRAWSQPRL
jgi:hypothetical protein